jgi:CheY-like chemotaxis protein
MRYFHPAPRKVLLVEDDESSRTALQVILEEEGFEVRSAGDGDEGITLVGSFRPDVIVLDLVLPGTNGFDAATHLKSDSTTSAIPLVAVTASWLGSESGLLRQIGFDSALRKPFSPAALVDELNRLLGDSAAVLSALPLA